LRMADAHKIGPAGLLQPAPEATSWGGGRIGG
jgi:hypothetical protein